MLVNGSEMSFKEDISISYLLDTLNLDPDKVVVEVDYEIISKKNYDLQKLKDDMNVEIISFVGGG